MGLELVVLAILEQCLGPRLERRVLQAQWIRDDRARKPDALFFRRCAAEHHATIGASRCRLCRTCLTSAACAALPCTTTGTPGASFRYAYLYARTFRLRRLLLPPDRFSEQWRDEQCGRGNGGEI